MGRIRGEVAPRVGAVVLAAIALVLASACGTPTPASSPSASSRFPSSVPSASPALSWNVTNVDGSNDLTDISCPSVNLCVATDTAGDVLTSTDPAGGSFAWACVQCGRVQLARRRFMRWGEALRRGGRR